MDKILDILCTERERADAHLGRGRVEGHTEDRVRVSAELVEEHAAADVIDIGLEERNHSQHTDELHSIQRYTNTTIQSREELYLSVSPTGTFRNLLFSEHDLAHWLDSHLAQCIAHCLAHHLAHHLAHYVAHYVAPSLAHYLDLISRGSKGSP